MTCGGAAAGLVIGTTTITGGTSGFEIFNNNGILGNRTARVSLTGNQNYYVNGNSGGTATCGPAGGSTCSAGSDSNDCLTPSTACLTLQNVVNIIYNKVDVAGKVITAYLAHNAGTTNYDLVCAGGSFIGSGVLLVRGDSSAITSTVVQDPNLGAGLQVKDLCTIDYEYISFIDSASTNATAHMAVGGTGNAGHLDFGNANLGGLAFSGASLIQIGGQGSFGLTGPITITAGATAAIQVAGPANITLQNQVLTLSGTPAFTEFALTIDGGEIIATSANFSGSATGARCAVFGAANFNGADPNTIFPGNANCVVNTLIGALGIQNGASASYGTAGHALLSGGGAGTKNAWDTAGVSCTLTTVSHLTVVNGIVTLCN